MRAVVLSDALPPDQPPTLAQVTLVTEFDLSTDESDWARMCGRFAADVSGRVSTLAVDVVLVRRADFHKNAKAGDGPRLRLAVEGAITAAAFGHVPNTHLRTGTACALAYEHGKDVLDAHGKELVSKASRTEAAAAALTALVANRT